MADLPEMLADLQDDDVLLVFRNRPHRPRQKPARAKWSVFKAAILASVETIEGDPGPPGASAYDVAVALGFRGTAAQWIASLGGAPGSTPTVTIGRITTLAAGAQATVANSGTASAMVLDFGIPSGAKGDAGPDAYQVAVAAGYIGTRDQWLASLKGSPASVPLGQITVGETIAVAIGSGIRRVVLTTPTAWGVDVGQNLMAFPVSVPSAQYAIHDVIVTAKNTISVGVSTPALALAATYSIACRLVRIPS